MRLKSGTRMTKIHTKAFSHRDTDDCALAFTGVTWNICWATCRKQLPGMGMPWQLKHRYHLFAFCSRGLVEDKTKQESRYHKALTNSWSLSLATPLILLTLQQGDVVCKIGAAVIWQTQSLLVGNLKSPNGRDPVTTLCLPHGRDTWSVKSRESQTLQFQCTGRIVLNSVSNYW